MFAVQRFVIPATQDQGQRKKNIVHANVVSHKQKSKRKKSKSLKQPSPQQKRRKRRYRLKHVTPNLSSTKKTVTRMRKKKTKKQKKNQFLVKPSTSEYAFQLLFHQRLVVQHMINHRGALVYHLPGSGKTRIPIVLTALLKTPTVVVVPASLIDNFWKEFKEVNRIKRISRHLFQVVSSHSFLEHAPDCTGKILVVDEAHELRNPEGKISQKILEQASKASKVLLLTGTPCVNGPQDIAPLLNLIVKNHMELKIKQGLFARDEKIFRDIPTGDRFLQMFGEDGLNAEGQKVWTALFPCLFSYYLPPMSNDFPTSTIEEVMVPMAPEQMKVYNAWESRNLTQEMVKMLLRPEKTENQKKTLNNSSHMSSSSSSSPPMFSDPVPKFQAYLDGGRRICNMVVTEGGTIIAPKFDAMIQKIEKSSGQAVVFSQYLSKGIDVAERLLQTRNISYTKFTGRESAQQKSEAVKLYNTKKVRVFLISTAGSLGLDLKNTETMHIMDPAWNLAKINQAIFRVRRYKSHDQPGSKVLIFKYFCYKPNNNGERGIFSLFNSKSKTKTKKTRHNLPSADIYLLQISQRKEAAIQKFLQFAIQHAMEGKQGQCGLAKL
jgi:SNF2 family DNA or RNA helicase